MSTLEDAQAVHGVGCNAHESASVYNPGSPGMLFSHAQPVSESPSAPGSNAPAEILEGRKKNRTLEFSKCLFSLLIGLLLLQLSHKRVDMEGFPSLASVSLSVE